MFNLFRSTVILGVLLLCSACSVVMATRNNGAGLQEISECKTRTCLVTAGLTPFEQKKYKNGKTASESLRGILPTGSALRASMHGLLDVTTGCIWEVIGTPMEAMKAKKTGYVVTATYMPDGETIKHMVFKF